MKKYHILIVGIKCYLGHILEFVVNLKKTNPLVEITLFTSPISDEVKKDFSGYVNHIVEHKPIQTKKLPHFVVAAWNSLRNYRVYLQLHRLGHFDMADIHFVNPNVKPVMPLLKKLTNHIVISPWGSDVMRVDDDSSLKEINTIFSQAEFITIGKGSQIGQCIIEKFNVDPEKMYKLGWGGEFFDYIQENANKVSVEDAKQRFGLSGKYVITCGYNTTKGQRHLEIINAIGEIKDQLPKNLVLLIPCTYVFFKGKKDQKQQYVESIVNRCKELGLEVVLVEEHLNMEDLLKLRMSTDIFVHIQQSDAGSRSVMEYVYCNKKLVQGAWVCYKYLEKYKPSCYFPVDQIEDLGSCILKAYNSPLNELPEEVKKIILERGWNHRMRLWNDFFESLVS